MPGPDHAQTVWDLLSHQAARIPEAHALQWLSDAGPELTWTYGELHAQALRMAAAWQALGVGPGDRVVLILPSGPEFLACFYGALALGAVVVPVYPPLRLRGLEGYRERLGQLLAQVAPRLIVTVARARMLVEAAASVARVRARVVEPVADGLGGASFVPHRGQAGDLALIQFSSGSTRAPRGVVLAHRHLLANVASVLAVIEPRADDVNCSWLPLYHDMGLIGGLLMPLLAGAAAGADEPDGFLARPQALAVGHPYAPRHDLHSSQLRLPHACYAA